MGLLSFLFGDSKSRRLATPPVPLRDPHQPEAGCVIHITDDEVRCERPDGKVERVAFDDLQAVIIRTTSDGPLLPDVFWLLVGTSAQSGCVIPQGATGDSALLERLQQLPGFDNEAFIQAMSCCENNSYLCWKRTS